MPYTPPSTLSSTPYKNFAKSSNRKNSSLPPKSHTRSRNESGRDERNSKAFPNGTSSMETQQAKERSDLMSSQAKEKDEKRETTSSFYDTISPYLTDNNAIPDIPRRQTENIGTDGPWVPSPSANLSPRQPSSWSFRRSTQTAPDLAGKSDRIFPSFQQLAAHSIVSPPEKDEAFKSKLHHSCSGQNSTEPTRRGVPGSPQLKYSLDKRENDEAVSGTAPNLRSIQYTTAREMLFVSATAASQFLEATPTNNPETANEESWIPMYRRLSPAYNYQVPPVQNSTPTDPLIASPRYSLRQNTTPPRRLFRPESLPYSSPFRNGYPSATALSPRDIDATERRELPRERYRRAHSRHEPDVSLRWVTFKRRPRYTSERPYSSFYKINRVKERLEPRKHVPMEAEDVQFQYQDSPQNLSKLKDNGANSRGRILARGRKKRGSEKKAQHSALDSNLDVNASAEKWSQEDESPSRTEPQLIGRQTLSDWKLRNGKSKDWRRKPSTKTLTARQFLTAIDSYKQLRYSPFHVEGPEIAGFGLDIPVAAQRSRMGKTSMVVRNEFPELLPWLDRKGITDMGMKRVHMRDIFDEGEFEVEPHRKLGLRPEFPAETDWDMDDYARQYQLLQAYPSAQISQDANPLHCLQIQYIGRVVPSPYGCFQLLEHMESSAHAEVYRICFLSTGHESFARIYTLRGIHPNQRERRVKSLKRLSQLDKLHTGFDWQGKKVCVFSSWYRIEYMGLVKEDSTPKAADIGAIVRRNTKEYDAEFPPLPSVTPIPVPTKVRGEATQPLTPGKSKQLAFSSPFSNQFISTEQQLQLKTLEVIKSEIEDTNPKRWKSISKQPLPLAQRLMIRLMDLNGMSVAKRNSEWKIRNCGVQLENKGNRKWNEDGQGKDLEVKKKKKRGRKKKSEKGAQEREHKRGEKQRENDGCSCVLHRASCN